MKNLILRLNPKRYFAYVRTGAAQDLLHWNTDSLYGFFGTRRKAFCQYADNCLTSGYIPHALPLLIDIGKFLAKLWIFIQVGRIVVVGRENLTCGDRVIYCSNHVSMFDPLLVYSMMTDYPRYLTAFEEMIGLWGLKAVFMGACGSFAVDRSKGKSVIDPAISVLVKGDPLVIFPEGKISPSADNLPYKLGSAIIAMGAVEQLNFEKEVGLVPIHIHYFGQDPQTAKGPYGAMGLKWRKGAVVTIGSPIWISDFDSPTVQEVTDAVFAAIQKQGSSINARRCQTQQFSSGNVGSIATVQGV